MSEMPMLQVEVNTYGGSPFATHNMPCAVCRENKAILDLSCGVMLPCRPCQKEGYRTIKFDSGSLLLKFVEWVMDL